MKKTETEIGGCCMGIPFGCSSVLLLFVGAGLWHYTGSAWCLLAVFAPSALAAVAAGVAFALRVTKRSALS